MPTHISHVFFLFVAAALIGAGCQPTQAPTPTPAPTQKAPDAMEKAPDAMEKPDAMKPKEPEAMAPKPEEAMMKKEASTFVDFTQAAYEKALADKKPIYLYFHANWCPTCKAQNPTVNEVFSQHMGGVAGFRVSYNDSDTNDEERALAKTFGVTYQHTFFYIDRAGKTVKKTIGSQTAAQITADLNTISN